MTQGLLLFAHGARDPRWATPFEDVANRVRQVRPDAAVQLAFLEFMQPGLMEGGTALVDQGCSRIDVVPLFLGTGGHVRKDLPALLDSLRKAFPMVTVQLHPSIGEVNSVIAAMADAVARTAGLDQAP